MGKPDTILVVNVISVSYSGSTWINLMLGAHPQAFSIGEMKNIHRLGRALCTLHGESCPIWSRFDHESEENPFLQLHRLTGQRVFIVNNSRKYLPPQQHPQVRSKFVHLVRDGRAVTASMLRKHADMTLWRAGRRWAHEIARNRRLIRRQPKSDRFLLHYEKAMADPTTEMRRICDFLELRFDPSMCEYWNQDHHFLGGNKGTLVALARKRDPNASIVEHNPSRKGSETKWDLDYYKRSDPADFVDERWKRELSQHQLRTFALAAGLLNWRLGYPISSGRTID